MGIETEFGVKVLEHKEWFWYLLFSSFFVRNRTNAMALNFKVKENEQQDVMSKPY